MVKSNVAIVGPRVRFSAGAFFLFHPIPLQFWAKTMIPLSSPSGRASLDIYVLDLNLSKDFQMQFFLGNQTFCTTVVYIISTTLITFKIHHNIMLFPKVNPSLGVSTTPRERIPSAQYFFPPPSDDLCSLRYNSFCRISFGMALQYFKRCPTTIF